MPKQWTIQQITDPPSRLTGGPPTISGEKMAGHLDHLSAQGWTVVSVFAFMAGHGPVVLAAAYRDEPDDVGVPASDPPATVGQDGEVIPALKKFTVDDYSGRDAEGKVVRGRIERLVRDGWAAGYLDDIKAGMVFRFSAPNRKGDVFKAVKDAVVVDEKIGVWACEVVKSTDHVEG